MKAIIKYKNGNEGISSGNCLIPPPHYLFYFSDCKEMVFYKSNNI